MIDIEKVKAKYPEATPFQGVQGGVTKYRIENRLGKHKNSPLSGWRNTPEEAWINAAQRLEDK
jgi:hypothetical protein